MHKWYDFSQGYLNFEHGEKLGQHWLHLGMHAPYRHGKDQESLVEANHPIGKKNPSSNNLLKARNLT
jgi:hypothetical protein